MLNIKNPETHLLARELADLEGITMTEAVTKALQAALAEHANRRRLRRQIMEGLITAARASGRRATEDPFGDLYDEAGLPG